MRWQVTPRAERLLSRLPKLTVYSAAELVLLVLVAVQAARLFWALVTPVGPLGDWKAPASLTAPPPAAALGSFDPFFRLSEGGAPVVVTGLNIQLFGVREDRATGRGSAILQLPDGSQRSFIVGEEIMPGVTLAEVGFDNVTIDRAGTREQVFLDQSQPAANGTPAQPGAAPPPAQATPAPTPIPVVNAQPQTAPLAFQPRMNNNQITGLVVSPGGDGGQAFRAAGFQAGDVVTQVNGQRVLSQEQAETLIRASGGNATVTVERGGRATQIRVRF